MLYTITEYHEGAHQDSVRPISRVPQAPIAAPLQGPAHPNTYPIRDSGNQCTRGQTTGGPRQDDQGPPVAVRRLHAVATHQRGVRGGTMRMVVAVVRGVTGGGIRTQPRDPRGVPVQRRLARLVATVRLLVVRHGMGWSTRGRIVDRAVIKVVVVGGACSNVHSGKTNDDDVFFAVLCC